MVALGRPVVVRGPESASLKGNHGGQKMRVAKVEVDITPLLIGLPGAREALHPRSGVRLDLATREVLWGLVFATDLLYRTVAVALWLDLGGHAGYLVDPHGRSHRVTDDQLARVRRLAR